MFSKTSRRRRQDSLSQMDVRTHTIRLRRVCVISELNRERRSGELVRARLRPAKNRAKGGPGGQCQVSSLDPRLPCPWVRIGSIALEVRDQWQRQRNDSCNADLYRGYPKLVAKNDMTRSASQRQPTAYAGVYKRAGEDSNDETTSGQLKNNLNCRERLENRLNTFRPD